MEKQYDTQIKTIQVNEGAEFKPLFKTLTQCGVDHCLTYPHTSAQNDIVESRYRHIVKRGLALDLCFSCLLNE